MRYIRIIALLLLVVIKTAVASAQDGTTNLEQSNGITTFTLSNGMTVWIAENHTQPKVYGAVVVKAGAKDCPNTGIAHYLEHLLFKGTQRIGTVDYGQEKPWLDSITAQYDLLARTHDAARRKDIQRHINKLSIKAADYAIPNEFSNLISRYGGTRLNAYTSFDETVFHNYFSPQYLRQWCELNAERLKDPVFRLFQGELEAVYEEKNMYADNLLASTAEKAQQFALAGTPYAWPIIGATDSLKNPRLSEMYRFFRQYYVAGNMGLILCGDIGADTVKPLLEATFGQLRRGEAPVSAKARLHDFRSSPVLRLKVPVPIVKAGGFAWQAPDEQSPDYAAFEVMKSMLSNGDKTGLLDSLSVSGKVFMAMAMGYDFKDFSAYGFGFVPNLPFGSRRKAEQRCLRQIDKLKRGEFSDDMLNAEKLTLQRNLALQLETISGKSQAMTGAFSHGLDWHAVANRPREIAAVTRADIMRVASTYLNDDSLKIVKKFGHYPKEHVSQPGYKPVRPKNAGRQSAYAKALAAKSGHEAMPKIVDFSQVKPVRLSPLVRFYATPNRENDVFTLQLIYHRGTDNDPRLAPLADYLNRIGAGGLDKRQFAKRLRQEGLSLRASASRDAVTLTLTGIDGHVKAALPLLHDFLTKATADERQFKKLVRSTKLEERTFFKDNANISEAITQYLMKGDRSAYLQRVSARELRRMGSEALMELFRDLQTWQFDVIYCGGQPSAEVLPMVKASVPVAQAAKPMQTVVTTLRPTDAATFYLFDIPHARQTIVGTYQQIAPQPTEAGMARLMMWGNYFGGGMNSVMFQDIREFHSLAYSAHGISVMADRKLGYDKPCGYLTRLGTQADKATTALLLLDSLMADMPVRESNIATARQAIVNNVNNGYPSFRQMSGYIASLQAKGYDHDPSADLVAAVRQMGSHEIVDFYQSFVKGRPHAVFVSGKTKVLDMQRLSSKGKIVRLHAKDIYKF